MVRMTSSSKATEAASDASLRFAFGRNWRNFLSTLNDARVRQAEETLERMLGTPLQAKSFLDAGSGSGLFSLAARRRGAVVRSFDFDDESVACTLELRQRFYPDDSSWQVERGSVLDGDYLRKLGRFDVVYSWGVLHHTGALYDACGKVAPLVADGGQLFIAIYNDQGRASKFWTAVKRTYNTLPSLFKPLLTVPFFIVLWGSKWLVDLFRLRPGRSYREYSRDRGMSPWHDVVDWIGGYPFEVAKPGEILDFFRSRGFVLEKLSTCGGKLGCNEYVFRRVNDASVGQT
jgi:2-polyprenyl-6-hydroxyphenyl methylase/3-demethylubiquinone-9 3-methyltransferase